MIEMVGGEWMDVVGEEKRRGRGEEQSPGGDEVLREALERRRAFLLDMQSSGVKSGLVKSGLESPVTDQVLLLTGKERDIATTMPAVSAQSVPPY